MLAREKGSGGQAPFSVPEYAAGYILDARLTTWAFSDAQQTTRDMVKTNDTEGSYAFLRRVPGVGAYSRSPQQG